MARKPWREALSAYSSPAALALLVLGFVAGLPAVLVFSTLSVWLREAGDQDPELVVFDTVLDSASGTFKVTGNA